MIHSLKAKMTGMIVAALLLLACMSISLVYGYTQMSWYTAFEALFSYNGSQEHIVVRTTRLPRVLIAAAVGASLAVAGVLMQTLTKNKLASPGIFGVNAGAAFFVVCAVTFFSVASLQQFAWIAFLGAVVSSALVYMLGSLGRDGASPLKLTLAGTAITALFSSLMQGMLVLNQRSFNDILFWLAGSVSGRSLDILFSILPYMIIGLLLSTALSGRLNTFSMGDDVASGLGQRVWIVKLVSGIAVVLLAGSSVAAAGPIGFVGLIIPNLIRLLTGTDHRWLIPFSALTGAILLLLADVCSRFVAFPEEVPVGVMTAFIGVPFLIAIIRKGMVK